MNATFHQGKCFICEQPALVTQRHILAPMTLCQHCLTTTMETVGILLSSKDQQTGTVRAMERVERAMRERFPSAPDITKEEKDIYSNILNTVHTTNPKK